MTWQSADLAFIKSDDWRKWLSVATKHSFHHPPPKPPTKLKLNNHQGFVPNDNKSERNGLRLREMLQVIVSVDRFVYRF